MCSWRPIKKLKTIDLKCLTSTLGMVHTCQADLASAHAQGVQPFPFTKWIYNRSLPIFEGAFASDEPAKGGCPPLALVENDDDERDA